MIDDRIDENFQRVFQLLDVISVEVALNRSETERLSGVMEVGFQRVDRRLGNIESRIEALEDQKYRR